MAEKKILVADCDANSLDTLVSLFEAQGLEVVSASDGQSAYEKYKSEEPDIVILEAMLPKFHGFDLTSQIYSETKGTVPVIIVTGLYKGSQYKNEALRSFGAADYFEKPINKEALLDSIMNLIEDDQDFIDDLPSPENVLKKLSDYLKTASQ